MKISDGNTSKMCVATMAGLKFTRKNITLLSTYLFTIDKASGWLCQAV